MLDAERCRRILRQAFPSLDIGDVRYFAQGWDYELWAVGGELLFRFPMREACVEPMRKEVRLLPELADALPVPIPRPEYVSHGCEAFGWPFYGYRKIEGTPLSEALLSDQQREAVAGELGRFLSALHRFPIERAEALGVRAHDGPAWRERYRRMQARCERAVAPYFSADERRAVEAFWRSFLGNAAHFAFRPTLLHGDLDGAHVLVDPEIGKMTGVIDFGDARVGDPAFDFSGYPEFKEETFDAPLREAILAAYELPLDETFRERAAIYRDRISPFHAVLHGIETGDDDWLQRGLAAVREWIAAPA
ncbi:MAG: phosphotransferase [Dehalococcoidia bacterium]